METIWYLIVSKEQQFCRCKQKYSAFNTRDSDYNANFLISKHGGCQVEKNKLCWFGAFIKSIQLLSCLIAYLLCFKWNILILCLKCNTFHWFYIFGTSFLLHYSLHVFATVNTIGIQHNIFYSADDRGCKTRKTWNTAPYRSKIWGMSYV